MSSLSKDTIASGAPASPQEVFPAGKLPTFHLQVASGSEEEVALWRRAIAPLYDLDMPDPAACRATTDTVFVGDMALSMTSATGGVLTRDAETIARGIDNIAVLLYRRGSYLLITDEGERRVQAGDFVLFDHRRPSRLSFSDHSHYDLIFSRKRLAGKMIDGDSEGAIPHGAILRRGEPMNNVLSAYLKSLVAELPALTLADAPRVAETTASLVAAAFGAFAAAGRHIRGGGAKASLAGMRRLIEDELGDPDFGAERIMARFAISRTPLYKLFEPLGGVQGYIRERRLHRALQSLASPDFAGRSIGDIAALSGFSSRSTFNRAFRETFGMSPLAIRAAALEGVAGKPEDADTFRVFMSHWDAEEPASEPPVVG